MDSTSFTMAGKLLLIMRLHAEKFDDAPTNDELLAIQEIMEYVLDHIEGCEAEATALMNSTREFIDMEMDVMNADPKMRAVVDDNFSKLFSTGGSAAHMVGIFPDDLA
jgi:hypothetical protein